LLAAFATGAAALRAAPLGDAPAAAPPRADHVPLTVRAMEHVPDDVYSLPRFWSQVGVL